MRSRTFQTEGYLVRRVDQYPVGLDVIITRWLPGANKSMIAMLVVEAVASGKLLYDFAELRQVLPALLHALEVSRELCGL
jgi:hypothetical protein